MQHHPVVLNETSRGIPFLGYVVRGNGLRLNLRSKRRFVTKMRNLTQEIKDGWIDQDIFAMRAGCLLAFADKADSVGFRKKMASSVGMYPKGLYPRVPWWRLAQHRRGLPRVGPPLHHADEHEQQPWTAPRPLALPRQIIVLKNTG